MFKRSKIAKANSIRTNQKGYGRASLSTRLFTSSPVSSNIRLFGSMIDEMSKNDIEEQLKWLGETKLISEVSVTDTSERAEKERPEPQLCFFSASWKNERKKQICRRERQRKKRRNEERLGKGGTLEADSLEKERTIGR